MSTRREVIIIDDDDFSESDNVSNTLANQIQRLERELNSSRNTVTYLQEYFQDKITSLEAENARVQAKYARLQVRYARLQNQRQAELLENPDEDDQTHPDVRGNGERRSGRFQGPHQETRPPKRPRIETQASIDDHEHLQTDSISDDRFGGDEAETNLTVWINLDKNLETDFEVDNEAWEDLKAIWADQVVDLDSKNPNWTSLDFRGKCLKTAVFLRGQNWTIYDPGKFACRNCTNTRKICVGKKDGGLVALPLAPEIQVESPSILQTYVADVEKISRKYIPGTIW